MQSLSRRRWLALTGVGVAMAGCRRAAGDSVVLAGAAASEAPPSPPRARANGTRTWVGVPRIDRTLRDRLTRLAAEGARRGVRRDVFAKVGDSITESGSFLHDVGHGWHDLGPYTWLAPTVAYFHRTPVDGDGNDSFAHASEAAVSGWTVDDALAPPNPDALDRELRALRPAIALVMFGTNDIDRSNADAYRNGLGRVVTRCIERGVIPVLSTIPMRLDGANPGRRVPQMNAIVRDTARANTIPLIDLHAALLDLPRHGLGDDGIHPSAYSHDGDVRAGTFTDEGLRHGYNVRNLVTLQTLDALRRIVFDQEQPEA